MNSLYFHPDITTFVCMTAGCIDPTEGYQIDTATWLRSNEECTCSVTAGVGSINCVGKFTSINI